MCESHAYLRIGDREELLFENVDRVEPQEDGGVMLENIFGQRKMIRARINSISCSVEL
jgi:predicted RNA-binding protein